MTANYNTEKKLNYLLVYSLLYLTLIIGFVFNENSTGGAIIDYSNQKKISLAFSKDFLSTFLNFENFQTRHSPIFIIFLSIFEKLNLNDLIIRLIHLHICLSLPIIFLLCIKEKFKINDISYSLFLLVGLVFLSPTYRSLSIWPDSRLLGLIFFCFSVYFYLKFENVRHFKYCVLNILFYTISSYISLNFAIFSIFFFYQYYKFYSLKSKKTVIIFLLNIVLSLPAFYYIFILDVNFINQSAAIGIKENERILFRNISNNFLLVSSIIFFYLIPFILLGIFKLSKKIKINSILIILFLFVLSVFFFDYNYNYSGGGIFFKLSYYLFTNNILFYLIAFASLIFIFSMIGHKYDNFLIIIILLLGNPQITVYHKYYDPMILILCFTLFNINMDFNKINRLSLTMIYLYFSIFLVISNIKFLWKI